ncbi:glycosyltransferase [Natrialbaceae archaeon AArc-T1-2]|uniref:glycosyltransferase n=1 Tax=Natrialbaceae archaeon AArc-T1-2 TaxID=3053904 RepID=UPI00255AAC8E|nr:glycosyltransferase [Natrialbaceae archaeon AArc-T1-2]WIV68695.1 glycosyltransferase [Natrialbaceae archaeon AArc-T1-2]
MRVAFVSMETGSHRDTEANDRIQRLIALLAERGHDVHVCCVSFWDGESVRLERDGVTYHGVADDLDDRRSFCLRLPFTLRSIGPDVIHATAEPPEQVLAANGGATLAGAPLFLEWDGEGGVDDGRLYRLAAGRPNRIVAPSRLVRTWIRELGADGDLIDVVPTPIDTDLIRETEPTDRTDVVYARRLDEDANLESLLLGLAELRDREWEATIIGDGPERPTYERLARDLRIDDRLTFVGEADREERIAIYRSAHVFAQTARRCVFPTELLWALAAGCVGIVEYHADSSAHELVEGRDRGFRTTSEDELTDAILEAGALEYRDYEPAFESFDREAVLERYLRRYRDGRATERLV